LTKYCIYFKLLSSKTAQVIPLAARNSTFSGGKTMTNCYVNMSGSIVLIWTSYTTCWLIRSESLDKIEEEPAPHMHNIHIGPHVEEFNIEDDYPFPKVREIFELKIPVTNLIDAIYMALEPQADDEMRCKAAVATIRIISGECGQQALAKVRTLFLDQDMFYGLTFPRAVIDSLAPEVANFLREAYCKHHGNDLPIIE